MIFISSISVIRFWEVYQKYFTKIFQMIFHYTCYLSLKDILFNSLHSKMVGEIKTLSMSILICQYKFVFFLITWLTVRQLAWQSHSLLGRVWHVSVLIIVLIYIFVTDTSLQIFDTQRDRQSMELSKTLLQEWNKVLPSSVFYLCFVSLCFQRTLPP